MHILKHLNTKICNHLFIDIKKPFSASRFRNRHSLLCNEIVFVWCLFEYFCLQMIGLPPNDFVQTASRRKLFFGRFFPLLLHTVILKQLMMQQNHSGLVSYVQTVISSVVHADSKGNPRNVTNSKGKKRRPSSKDLASVLKTNDPLFLDFIRRCLEYVHLRLNQRWVFQMFMFIHVCLLLNLIQPYKRNRHT